MKIKLNKTAWQAWVDADSIIRAEENHGMTNDEVVEWVCEIASISRQEIRIIQQLVADNVDPENPDEE